MTVKQQLENDLGLEQAALTVLKPGITTCIDAHGDATRELLEHLVVDEERHIDWIETQLHQIKEIGYENYLTHQIHKKTSYTSVPSLSFFRPTNAALLHERQRRYVARAIELLVATAAGFSSK